jgi:molecular chaperone Hsp33
MSVKDAVIPFVFDELPVRGALVQLDTAWQRMRGDHDYPAPVAQILGQAAAATALIAQSLKFHGSVTLQIVSDGPLGIVVVQSTNALDLRGMSTGTAAPPTASYAELVTKARCAVTVDAGEMERPYQGIVEISADSLAASLENYFRRSVQVPSHLQLVSSDSYCGGILLQRMPGEVFDFEDDWRRLGFLAETLRAADLENGASLELLHKLFVEDDVRAFQSRSLCFKCRCSRERVEDVLRMLGEEESRSTLAEQGSIDVTCEYCGRLRSFDAIDVSCIFADTPAPESPSLH